MCGYGFEKDAKPTGKSAVGTWGRVWEDVRGQLVVEGSGLCCYKYQWW